MQDGYGILNAAIEIGTADERLSLSVFGRNLFDKNFVTSIFNQPFDGAGALGQFATRDAERTLDVQASLRF